VLVNTLVLAIVPFILGAWGGHLAAEAETEPKRKRRIKLAFWGVCVIGIVFTFYQQYKASRSDAYKDKLNEDQKAKLDSLGLQNDSILRSLTPKEQTADEAEADRRQQIMLALRKKYILSHDVVPSKLVAGDEEPPADWINSQLTAMNENWSVSPLPEPEVTAKGSTHTHVELYKTGFSSNLPRPFVNLGYRSIGSGVILHASLRGDLKIAPWTCPPN